MITGTTRMEKNEVLSLRGETRCVECVSGFLWLTAINDNRDRILRKGDRVELRGLKDVCMQALRQSEIAIGR